MDKVRLALVGCGWISGMNAPGYLSHEQCEVTVLCDPLRERAEARAKEWGITPRIYTDYTDLLNDPQVDAVELLTPTKLHTQQIIDALEVGKHVSCQKPHAVSVAEADQVIAAAERANTKFRVTENFLFYPPILKAKELIDEGAIGDPTIVRIHTVVGVPPKDAMDIEFPADSMAWRQDLNTLPGGMLYDDGWHKFATAMLWIGQVDRVFAMVGKGDDYFSEMPAAVMWRFREKDCLALFDHVNAKEMPVRGTVAPVDEFFEIQGTRGAIWVTRCTGEFLDMPPLILMTGNKTESFQMEMKWSASFDGSARHFIDSILTDQQPDMDAQLSKKVLQAALACYESSKIKGEINPDLVV